MRLLTRNQSRRLDQVSMEKLEIPGLMLMENAGKKVAEVTESILEEKKREKQIAICCGKGNNGGDGFYGSCQVPYLEPVFKSFEINGSTYNNGMCPVAESIQSKVMQFKTNYRDLDLAKEKVQILQDLVKSF